MTPGELKNAVGRLIAREKSDLFIYSADMESAPVERFRKIVFGKQHRRETAILFLTTAGGDADAAYRLAACLKRLYKSFSVYVFGRCKSAGTLAVLGARSVVLGDYGELGPLDVQLAKRDELLASNSGLDIFQAVSIINNAAFECFEQSFLSLITRSGGSISAKMAAEIAREMATGLFSTMTAQIDPERLGEVQRAINIANAYGERLDGSNLKRDALEKLVQGYPSHSFVIDFAEATTIFNRVRMATGIETAIADAMPGIRNRIDVSVIMDLEDAVSTAPGGAPNATKAKAKRPRRAAGARGGGTSVAVPAASVGNAPGDPQAPKEDGDAAQRPTRPKVRGSPRPGNRPRLVRA